MLEDTYFFNVFGYLGFLFTLTFPTMHMSIIEKIDVKLTGKKILYLIQGKLDTAERKSLEFIGLGLLQSTVF